MMKYLNIGCGHLSIKSEPDDEIQWVNMDCDRANQSDPNFVWANAKDGLPFGSDLFDAVYHSHVLEHLPHYAAPQFLSECFRVMKPGAVMRVVVPDLHRLAKAYVQSCEALEQGESGNSFQIDLIRQHQWQTTLLVDQLVRHYSGGKLKEDIEDAMIGRDSFESAIRFDVGDELVDQIQTYLPHPNALKTYREFARQSAELSAAVGNFRTSGEPHLWMYDAWSLYQLLKQAGFDKILGTSFRQSRIKDFPFELDCDPSGKTARKPDSLFMECIKPL